MRSQKNPEYKIVINSTTDKAVEETTDPDLKGTYKLMRIDPKDKKKVKKVTLIRDGGYIPPGDAYDAFAGALKEIGVTSVTAFKYSYWDVACEHLCGEGHNTMQSQMVVISQKEYSRKHEGKTSAAAAATQPTASAAAISTP